MSILIFIIILGLLIFVHEFGHFIVAKKTGMRVDEFAVGFPPKLLSWVKNGTKYSLNLIPFGGYVKIFGENPDEESLDEKANDSFVNKSKWAQASVLIAGVTFNVLFAWILFSIAFMIGFEIPKDTFPFVDNSNSTTQVLQVQENSPAEVSGIKIGSEILSIEKNDEIFEVENADEALSRITNTETPFSINTPDDTYEFNSKLQTDNGDVVGLYVGEVVNTKTGFFDSFIKGYLLTGFSIQEITVALYNLITDSFQGDAELENIAGPVGIVGLVGEAAKDGFVNIIIFTAFISVNLAIINLVPFPALDGGRLLFVAIEAITRKQIKPSFANILNLIGFLILIGLMIVITISDIGKLF